MLGKNVEPRDFLWRDNFDQVAMLYKKARPVYPDDLFSTLVKVIGLTPPSRLLEIGPGTGQATKPLAALGYDITAIELGESMAAVARHELRSYSNVRIITGAFEEVDLPDNSFDLVLAATSFHWIRPELRFSRPYQLLKPKGQLVIIHTHHVSDQQGDVFFKASQPVYDRYQFTDSPAPPVLPDPAAILPTPFDESMFRSTYFKGFPLVITYTASQFTDLLNTYSNHLAAPAAVREGFLGEIRDLIDQQFGGSIQKHFLMSLTIGQKIN